VLRSLVCDSVVERTVSDTTRMWYYMVIGGGYYISTEGGSEGATA
jgi:hypothetical protein